MAKRRVNPRLAKLHRNYTVDEVARLFGVHRQTVRGWISRGLPTTDRQRPALVLGCDLVAFLQERRTKNKRPCQADELYCMRCRMPRRPAVGMVEYVPVTAGSGNVIAICPDCCAIMNRRMNLAQLDLMRRRIDVTISEALRHIGESR